MFQTTHIKQFAAGMLAAFMISCGDKKEDPAPTANERYLLMTMSEIVSAKPGFVSAFETLPTGDVSNVKGPYTMNGQGMGGMRTYKDQAFKMFNSSNEKGIVKLSVSTTGSVFESAFIKTNNTINGSGNFVIQDETKGYYWDGDKPWEIQTFNPTTMTATGKINYNFETTLKKTDAGINFQGIGQHFLAIKEGKLYADITYSKGSGAQSGMFNDFFPDVYIAVINLASGQHEKTIKIADTGSITYINENEMFSFDTNGDLYIVTQGRNALGTASKIVRIKAGASDIDTSWELKFDDVRSTGGKFVGVLAKNNKLYITLNNAALTSGATGNINTGEIWEFYSVDVATKALTKISGVPASTNSGAAKAAFELDGKILIRVNAPSQSINGFFEVNGTAATKVFGVKEGGAVTSLSKIKL